MYTGMADVAALTGDQKYLAAIDDIWNDVVSKKIYVTGGIGATGSGEAFGKPYELPNMSAYNETCASIANVYWNYRLFLLHGEAKYFDVLERTLYNAFLSGVALTGDKFFYPNPLESHGQHARSPWFACACCPSNVTRFVPSIGGYFYAQKDKSIYVNLFAEGDAQFVLPDNKVKLEQKTNYPWDGDIVINVSPEKSSTFELKVRIPGWAVDKPIPSDLYQFEDKSSEQPKVFLNDKPVTLVIQQGYVSFNRKWKKGDRVHIQLPMPIRRIKANDQVEADKNKLAIERGPLMYCAEWPDNKDNKVLNLVLPSDASLKGTLKPDLLKGIYVLEGKGMSASRTTTAEIKTETTDVKLIPYYSWAHRGAGEMMVWIPEKADAARPLPAPTIASGSKISASTPRRTLLALNDQMEPKNSNDQSIIFYHWWPMKDTVQWVQYDFEKQYSVSSSNVYWFDDGTYGECRIPAAWRLLYKKGDEWVPVKNLSPYEVNKDQYSSVKFESVTTNALRLEITLPEKYSSGMMEWIVK